MKKIFFISAILITLIGFSNSYSKSNKFEVKLKDNHLFVYNNGKEMADVLSINFNFAPPKSLKLISQTSKTTLIEAIYPKSAKYGTGAQSDLIDTITVTNNGSSLRFYTNPRWASNVTVQLKDLDEHYFGIEERLYPNNLKSPDLRGQAVDVEVIGQGSQYHENYASVWSAFYISTKGYASFFDTFASGKYQFAINGVTELYHWTGELDWYLIPGNNGDKIMQTYYSIIGQPKFIPLWACGPIIWRDEFKGKDQILDDVKRMTDMKIPITGLMADRPYSNGADNWSKMDFNSKFSNPKEWISELNDKYNIQFMTWVGPMTFSDKDFTGLLPNYKGYIDLTDPAAVKEFEIRMKDNQYSVNVRGHKMDRADEDFPYTSPWYDKTPESERRNKYIFLYAKTIDKFLTDAYGKDEFNYARAAYQRCQPYLSAVWGGDSRATWDGLAGSIANAVRVSFTGFPVWGSDVGGYLGGRISEKLYARWLEFGTWSGMFEIKIDNTGGRGEDRPPWKYGEELQNVFRRECDLRMNLMPYIYSAANTSYKNGVIMKPLAYEFPNDVQTYKIWDEYLFGNAFLVAPIYDSLNSRKIYLPAGTWYDFNNLSKSYEGGSTINYKTTLDKLPVLVRENSIYVTGKIFEGNGKSWETGSNNSLTIHIFPGKESSTFSFDYVDSRDSNKEKNILVKNGKNKIDINIEPINSDCGVSIKSRIKPTSIKINGSQVQFSWNKENGLAAFSLNKNEKASVKIGY